MGDGRRLFGAGGGVYLVGAVNTAFDLRGILFDDIAAPDALIWLIWRIACAYLCGCEFPLAGWERQGWILGSGLLRQAVARRLTVRMHREIWCGHRCVGAAGTIRCCERNPDKGSQHGHSYNDSRLRLLIEAHW